jgi:hypothetical protein
MTPCLFADGPPSVRTRHGLRRAVTT